MSGGDDLSESIPSGTPALVATPDLLTGSLADARAHWLNNSSDLALQQLVPFVSYLRTLPQDAKRDATLIRGLVILGRIAAERGDHDRAAGFYEEAATYGSLDELWEEIAIAKGLNHDLDFIAMYRRFLPPAFNDATANSYLTLMRLYEVNSFHDQALRIINELCRVDLTLETVTNCRMIISRLYQELLPNRAADVHDLEEVLDRRYPSISPGLLVAGDPGAPLQLASIQLAFELRPNRGLGTIASERGFTLWWHLLHYPLRTAVAIVSGLMIMWIVLIDSSPAFGNVFNTFYLLLFASLTFAIVIVAPVQRDEVRVAALYACGSFVTISIAMTFLGNEASLKAWPVLLFIAGLGFTWLYSDHAIRLVQRIRAAAFASYIGGRALADELIKLYYWAILVQLTTYVVLNFRGVVGFDLETKLLLLCQTAYLALAALWIKWEHGQVNLRGRLELGVIEGVLFLVIFLLRWMRGLTLEDIGRMALPVQIFVVVLFVSGLRWNADRVVYATPLFAILFVVNAAGIFYGYIYAQIRQEFGIALANVVVQVVTSQQALIGFLSLVAACVQAYLAYRGLRATGREVGDVRQRS